MRVAERTLKVSVRLSPSLVARLDALADARGLSRSVCLRQLVADASLLPGEEVPGHRELLQIAAERARAGNMAAVRMLLDREADRSDADLAFEAEFGVRLDDDH